MGGEEKKIVAYACENSGLLAAEALADTTVHELVDFVRVPCTGRVEIGMILKCLEDNHPGVLVLGCPTENCKYIRGSARAAKRVEAAKKALSDAGLNENRFHMDFVSSVDGNKLGDVVRQMDERLRSL